MQSDYAIQVFIKIYAQAWVEFMLKRLRNLSVWDNQFHNSCLVKEASKGQKIVDE